MAKPLWEIDAEEFGRRFVFGEWESAILVARSAVYQPGNSNVSDVARRLKKATVPEFAAKAQVGAETIRAYFKTWNLASEDGLIPRPDELRPGQAVEVLPAADDWDHYYRTANPARTKAVSPREALDVAAGAAIADSTTTLTRAVELVRQASEEGLLDARRKANIEIMFREIDAKTAEGRQYLLDEDLDAELAELLGGVG